MEEKSKNNEDFKELLRKLNPFAENLRNQTDGKILESKKTIYWRKFANWLINILLNGLFLNFILFIFHLQPLNPVVILGDGILVWFSFEALSKIVGIIKS